MRVLVCLLGRTRECNSNRKGNDNGDNRLIESKKGKLFCAPPEEAEIIKNVLKGKEMDLDLLNNAEIDDYY